MIKQHNHVDLRVVAFGRYQFRVLHKCIKRSHAARKVVEARAADKLVMDASNSRRHGVGQAQFKVDNRVALDIQVAGNEISKRAVVVHVQVESVIGDRLNSFSEQLVHDSHTHHRLDVRLFVRAEFVLPVEMDAERGKVDKSFVRTPVLADQFLILFDDDFNREDEISIEPGAPKASSVSHHVELAVAELVNLRNRCELQARGVCVAADDLEG